MIYLLFQDTADMYTHIFGFRFARPLGNSVWEGLEWRAGCTYSQGMEDSPLVHKVSGVDSATIPKIIAFLLASSVFSKDQHNDWYLGAIVIGITLPCTQICWQGKRVA